MNPSYSSSGTEINICGGKDSEEWLRAIESCDTAYEEEHGRGIYR